MFQKLTPEEDLRHRLSEHIQCIKALEREAHFITEEKSRLEEKEGRIEGRMAEENRLVREIKRQLLILAPMSKELSDVRDTFLRMVSAPLSEYRVTDPRGVVVKEMKALLQTLQQKCPHSFILEYDGFEGSPEIQYEDERCGSRVCIVCGFTEASKNVDGIYTQLVPCDMRLIKRDTNNEIDDSLARDLFIKLFPFIALRRAFLESVHVATLRENARTS